MKSSSYRHAALALGLLCTSIAGAQPSEGDPRAVAEALARYRREPSVREVIAPPGRRAW